MALGAPRCLFALVFAILLATAGVHAQGTRGQLPDPAESRTLSRHLERFVAPTVQQWQRIEDLHEAYLERFAALREGDLARFLAFVEREMAGVPDAATAREFLRRLQNARRRIDEEDARLHAGIDELLEEAQRPGLNRVRLARQRESLASGLAESGNSQVFDIWSILDEHAHVLGAEVIKALDPVMIGYEQELTAALRVWRAAQESMFLVLVEELQARGLGELSAADATPEQMQEAVQAIRLAFDSAQAESRVAQDRVRKLNDRTIKRLEELLGPMHGRRIRMAHVERASRKTIRRDPGRIERTIARLLALEDLDSEVRDGVLSVRGTHRSIDDRHVARMLEAWPELDRQRSVVVDDDIEAFGTIAEIRETLETSARQRTELAESSRDALLDIIEPTGRRDLVAIIERGGLEVDEDAGSKGTEALSERDPERGGPGDFMPKRLSRRDLERICRGLGPEPWQQAVIDTIHRDYVETWRAGVDPIVQSARSAHASVHGVDTETMLPTTDVEQLRRAYALARDAVERITVIDGDFFDDLAVALNEDQLPALLRSRTRRALDRCLRGTDPFFDPAGMAFRPANLIAVLDGIELDDDESARVDSYLAESAPGLIAAARVARDVRFASELRLHELNMRMAAGMAEGTLTSSDHGIEYRRLSDAMALEHGEHVEAWRRMHDQVVSGLVERLGPGSRENYTRAWKQASNPYVYRDANCAIAPIEQVLQIPDLSSEQLDAVAAILAEYDAEWSALCEDMVVIREKMKMFGADSSPEDYDLWRTLDADYRALEFRRDEASIKALRRVSRYLEPEQRSRVRALRRLEQ